MPSSLSERLLVVAVDADDRPVRLLAGEVLRERAGRRSAAIASKNWFGEAENSMRLHDDPADPVALAAAALLEHEAHVARLAVGQVDVVAPAVAAALS